MAYFALKHHTTFEDATNIADEFKDMGAVVSVRQHNSVLMAHRKQISPIDCRGMVKGIWYNYHLDGTRSRSVPDRKSKQCLGYAPYIPCPDSPKLDELLFFCYSELLPLKGKGFQTYLFYLTENMGEVLYSVQDGIVQSSIELRIADNPVLHYEHGGPRHVPRRTGRYGKRRKDGATESLGCNIDDVIDDGD